MSELYTAGYTNNSDYDNLIKLWKRMGHSVSRETLENLRIMSKENPGKFKEYYNQWAYADDMYGKGKTQDIARNFDKVQKQYQYNRAREQEGRDSLPIRSLDWDPMKYTDEGNDALYAWYLENDSVPKGSDVYNFTIYKNDYAGNKAKQAAQAKKNPQLPAADPKAITTKWDNPEKPKYAPSEMGISFTKDLPTKSKLPEPGESFVPKKEGKPGAGIENIINAPDSAGAENIITEIKYKPSSGVNLKANPNKTTTVLGSFGKDMKNIINEMGNVKSTYFGGKKGGFNVLNVSDDMYKTANQFWDEVNVQWLDDAIARGDDFILATKPTDDMLWKIDPLTRTKTLTGFGREYKHMISNGYAYDPVTSMMVRK